MNTFAIFNKNILDTICRLFPNTKIYQVRANNIYDLTFELREGKSVMQYTPYMYYEIPANQKQLIQLLIDTWRDELNKVAV